MDLLQFNLDKLGQVAAMLVSPASICALPQLAVAYGLAALFLATRQRRRRGRVRWRALRRALSPVRALATRSSRADLFYLLVNSFAIGGLIGWGLVSGLAVSDLVRRALDAGLGVNLPSGEPAIAWRVALTVALFLAYELGYYLDHVLKHRVPALWAFHKVHHTAETLTPLTVFRVHPLDTLIFADIVAVTVGVTHGVMTHLAGRAVAIFAIDGANAITVACLFALAQLQHSPIWLPLPGGWGRVILSPAHHQLHHSADPAHHDSNYGSYLAVWDWLFGTLAIPPRDNPRLRFGAAAAGDPHRIWSLLIEPLAEAARSVNPRRSQMLGEEIEGALARE